MTTDSKNFNYNNRIDELRGIACLLVFLAHVGFDGAIRANIQGTLFEPLTKFWGGFGVGIFFVLCGYLFTSIFLKKEGEIDYKNFILNRVIRIFPLFIFVYLYLFSVYPEYFASIVNLIPFFLWNNVLHYAENWGSFIFLWTISVEFQFYFAFPFLFKFMKDKKSLIIVALVLLSVVRLFASVAGGNIYYASYTAFSAFIVGMGLSFLLQNIKEERLPPLSYFLFFALLFATSYFSDRLYSFSYDLVYLLIALFIGSYLFSKRRLPMIYKPLEWLGNISYSFYLMHTLVLGFSYKIIYGHVNVFLYYLICLVLTIGVSTLSYFAIEKPFMSLKRKY